jgi:tRNA A-37 threonylcarbamoyl transferase component Bud32
MRRIAAAQLPESPSMNAVPERQVLEWFEAIVALPVAERRQAIINVCGGDTRLKRRLEAMLAADGKPTRDLVSPLRVVPADDEATVNQQGTPTMVEPGAMAPQNLSITAGMRIDRYEIIRELGRGGMGAVYLARDTRLGRRVAIKFLQSHDPRLTERFIVEAQATARCSHEHIVVIHDVRELHGNPFMVLEYLKGQPLGKLLGDDRLTPSRALQLAVPIVRALVCAHAQKIVHRDLKPANIFMTDSGTIKVLDFGIAKFVHESTRRDATPAEATLSNAMDLLHPELTRQGMLVGTLPYMSPEQWGANAVDHRTDIWAMGILLYRMVVGRHPLAPLDGHQLMVTAVLEQPMPSARNAGVDMPLALADIIDHCLKKRRDERMPSAAKLLTALETLLPGRRAPELASDESPYTGLTAFQEADAGRFFGRAREIGAVVARLHSASLIGVVGPSGVGKSSFIRAGVIPALKHSGELWESMVIRPGRHPMAALANIVTPMITSEAAALSDQLAEHQATLQRLYQEPGYLGTVLRNRARAHGRKLLLFVDQFEELYTMIREPEERLAFTACLAGMADDPVSPLRLILSIRSDFLDRVAEDQHFMGELSQNLMFVTPPDRAGLRDAIVRPAEMMRYRFETPAMVEHMLDTLQTTPGCLPLLQFAATKLWDARDRDRRLLTEQSYRRFGGVVGALATHADAVLAAMPPPVQALARTVLLQLVTPERTRAIASVAELCELTGSVQEVERVIHQLVDARLLVIQRSSRNGGATVEIVHEALIQSWPTLTQWLDENQGDAVFLEQLRTAAKQWEARGRSPDLLWRGETMQEARGWHRRYRGTLPALQEEYLRAVFALAARTARTKRTAVVGTIAFLSLLVTAAAVALVWIHDARSEAKRQAAVAQAAMEEANRHAAAVQEKLDLIERQQVVIHKKDGELQEKEGALEAAVETVSQSRAELVAINRKLQQALDLSEQTLADAKAARAKAEDEAEKARLAEERMADALAKANKAQQETQRLLEDAEKRANLRDATVPDTDRTDIGSEGAHP